jgi:hypothetical protein
MLLAKLFDLLPSQENPLPGCLELPCQMIEMNVHRKEDDFCGLSHVMLFLLFPNYSFVSPSIIVQDHHANSL